MPIIDRPEWWSDWVDKHVPTQPLHLNENMEMLHLQLVIMVLFLKKITLQLILLMVIY